jgi:hypothetical protein
MKTENTITTVKCPVCKQFIEYRKIEFIRRDGAYDWDLKIKCACGPVADPGLVAKVEAFHKIQAGHALQSKVRIEMNRILGRPLLDALDRRFGIY